MATVGEHARQLVGALVKKQRLLLQRQEQRHRRREALSSSDANAAPADSLLAEAAAVRLPFFQPSQVRRSIGHFGLAIAMAFV